MCLVFGPPLLLHDDTSSSPKRTRGYLLPNDEKELPLVDPVSWQVLPPFRLGVLSAPRPRLGVRCQRDVLGEGLRTRSGTHKSLLLLPFPVIRITAILGVVNIVVWVAVATVLRSHPLLTSSGILSYTLGFRHALGADHICAIDLMARCLVASGLEPGGRHVFQLEALYNGYDHMRRDCSNR